MPVTIDFAKKLALIALNRPYPGQYLSPIQALINFGECGVEPNGVF